MTLLTATAGPAEPLRKSQKRALLAGFLSLLFPGTGQILNRQPRKAILLALPVYILDLVFVKTRLVFTFWTMVLTMFLGAMWRLFLVVEASHTAVKDKPAEPPVPMPRLTYSLLIVAFLAPVLGPYPDLKKNIRFAAFSVPSVSMCPTICTGERVVADMKAYQSTPPQRGDLILMKHASSNALFVKRVIGIPSDTVEPGPDGSILVSGKPFVPPQPCNTPRSHTQRPSPDDYQAFKAVVVPQGTFFVVGDNTANSFDSRIPEFGPVTAEMIRGKPLYLYWSPIPQRIGCPLR